VFASGMIEKMFLKKTFITFVKNKSGGFLIGKNIPIRVIVSALFYKLVYNC